jgi:hypothetical protein
MNDCVSTSTGLGTANTCNRHGRAAHPRLADPTGWPQNRASVGEFKGKINQIKRPSDIILFVCEDEQTLDDGIFSATTVPMG